MKKKSKIVSKRGQYTKEATKKACKKVAEMETCGKFSKHHYKSQSVLPTRAKTEKISAGSNNVGCH